MIELYSSAFLPFSLFPQNNVDYLNYIRNAKNKEFFNEKFSKKLAQQ